MRKKGIYSILSILILPLFLTIVHSILEASDVSLELNPLGVAINPITDIAVVANEKANSVSDSVTCLL